MRGGSQSRLCAMPRLPQRYAPFVYGVIQAAVTTAIATGVATHQLTEFGVRFVEQWALAWLIAWITMLPVVILIAPLLQRAVAAMTAPPAVSRTDRVDRSA